MMSKPEIAKPIPKPDFMTDEAWAALMANRNAEIIRAAGREHAHRYQETKGEGTSETRGGPTLLLTTIGRKTVYSFGTCRTP